MGCDRTKKVIWWLFGRIKYEGFRILMGSKEKEKERILLCLNGTKRKRRREWEITTHENQHTTILKTFDIFINQLHLIFDY